jgi:microcystin-dependent protein
MSVVITNRNWIYPAPENMPTEYVCRRIRIPKHINILGAVNEAISYLTLANVWEASENVSSVEMQALMSEMWYQFVESDCMIGSVVPVIRADLPDYMLPCDGSTYDRVDYPDLYEMLDPAYILDADTFQTPDLRGLTIIGANDTYPVNSTGGEAEHTLTTAEMPSHSHTDSGHAHAIQEGVDVPVFAPGEVVVTAFDFIPGITGTASANIQNTGGGAAHNNMQPYKALKYAVIAK